MKKHIAFFLTLCLLLSMLAACGGSAPASTTAAPETTAPATEPAPSGPSQAAIDALDGKKIIFIGNSYTYWGGVVNHGSPTILDQESRTGDTGLFYQLCKENGIDVSVTNWAFGAHDLTDIMSNECLCTGQKCEGINHMSYLTDASFDYVALQLFFESEYEGNLLEHIKPTMDFFREANPDVKFLFLVPHMTFVRKFQWADQISTLAETDILVCNWGGMLNDIVNKVTNVPGGTQQYFQASFVISKDEADGHHQNLLVGYLTALMAYCAITGDSAVGQPYGFADDPSINPKFDMEAFRDKYYVYEPFTNFVDIYRSETDMNGLQQLTDTYIQKYTGGK